MRIEFQASLPPIQSAVKIDGSEGNARVQLDVPASEMPELIKVPAYCSGKIFRVIIEVEE